MLFAALQRTCRQRGAVSVQEAEVRRARQRFAAEPARSGSPSGRGSKRSPTAPTAAPQKPRHCRQPAGAAGDDGGSLIDELLAPLRLLARRESRRSDAGQSVAHQSRRW